MPYDLHFQSLKPDEALASTKITTFGYEKTLGVSGFQLCINMWLKIFLTRRGSDPTNLNYGTSFTNLIGSSTSVSDAEDVVRISVDQCNQQLTAIQRKDTSYLAKERLADARLYRFVPKPSDPGFEAYVEISNQAGQKIVLNIPDFS